METKIYFIIAGIAAGLLAYLKLKTAALDKVQAKLMTENTTVKDAPLKAEQDQIEKERTDLAADQKTTDAAAATGTPEDFWKGKLP